MGFIRFHITFIFVEFLQYLTRSVFPFIRGMIARSPGKIALQTRSFILLSFFSSIFFLLLNCSSLLVLASINLFNSKVFIIYIFGEMLLLIWNENNIAFTRNDVRGRYDSGHIQMVKWRYFESWWKPWFFVFYPYLHTRTGIYVHNQNWQKKKLLLFRLNMFLCSFTVLSLHEMKWISQHESF